MVIAHNLQAMNAQRQYGMTTKKNELVGKGFNSTCCTCNDFYSVEFVTGQPSSIEESGDNFVYLINIDGVSDGKELTQRIIDGTEGGYPNHHFTKLAQDALNKNILYIYDDRSKESEADVLTRAATAGWVDGTSILKDWDYPLYNINANPRGKCGEGAMRRFCQTITKSCIGQLMNIEVVLQGQRYFDENEEYKQFFETTKDVDRILQNLMLASGQKILPESELIIFDDERVIIGTS